MQKQTIISNTQESYIFLFDLDGTLVITDEIYLYIWNTIMRQYNIDITYDIFKTYIQGNNDYNVLIKLLPNNFKELLPNISTIKDKYFLEYLDKIKIIDGAIDFLNKIKQTNFKIGIVTNCNKIVAKAIIEYIGISNIIDILITSDDCIKPKPYPEPYLNAIKQLNSSNEKTIIFEDSKVGIQSGKNSFPKCLIGIETIYDTEEMNSMDVDFSIKNYINLDFNKIINNNNNNNNNNILKIKSYIYNSVKKPISNIDILNYKLKGGFISDVIGVKITLQNGEIMDCVLKLENKKQTFLSIMANELKLYDREYYFYENFYNYINISTPEYYTIIKDDNFNNIGILMNNLSNKGFLLNLDLNKEKIDVSLKIIERIAQLHSKFWNKDLSKNFKEIKKNSDPCFSNKWPAFIKSKWPIFKTKWENILSKTKIQKAEYIVNNYQNIQNLLSDKNLTLIHGDVKSANIFYEKTINGYEPYFIDWQYICEGKGVQDLVFFMIESFDIETIKQYRDIFKEYYYIKLLENGVKQYSRDEYEKDFINSIYYFPFFVAIWFGTINDDELIEKNFPFFFIQKLFSFMSDDIYPGE